MLDMAWRSGVDTSSFSKNANAMLGRSTTMIGANVKKVTLPDAVKPEDRYDAPGIINAFKGLL